MKNINNDYYSQRNRKCEDRIELLSLDLPYFCVEFFYGISNTTTPLTRLNYAYDLRIFFKYVHEIKKISIEDMKIDILDDISSTDIERFLNYLTHYKISPKYYK